MAVGCLRLEVRRPALSGHHFPSEGRTLHSLLGRQGGD